MKGNQSFGGKFLKFFPNFSQKNSLLGGGRGRLGELRLKTYLLRVVAGEDPGAL